MKSEIIALHEANVPHIQKTFNLQTFSTYILDSKNNFTRIAEQIRQTDGETTDRVQMVIDIFLRVFDASHLPEQKLQALETSRNHYKGLVAKYVKGEDVVTKTPLKRDPLSKDSGNGQSTSYFENHELKNQIKIDIQRTYNEFAFFSNQRVKNILFMVLFLWAKDNSSISYIQGMHEVAASVIYVYFQECLGQDVQELYGESEEGKLALQFNDVMHAEADVYTLLKCIFNDAQHMEMFRPNYTEKQKILMKSKKQSPILNRISKLKDVQLKIVDLELFRHLKLLDVELSVFLLRWLRCIFTREFGLTESFVLWDAIFLEYSQSPQDNNLHLIDCMALAMMSVVRGQVLEQEESSQCYQKFLNFPQMNDLRTLIDVAYHYKAILNDPVNYRKVMDTHVPVLMTKLSEENNNYPQRTKPVEREIPKVVAPPLNMKQESRQPTQTIKPQLAAPIIKSEPIIKIKEEKLVVQSVKAPLEHTEKMIKFSLDNVQVIINALQEGINNIKKQNNSQLNQTLQDMEEIKLMMEQQVEKYYQFIQQQVN